MVFSSPVFLFLFLPAVLAAHSLCPARHRNSLLLYASILFYGWGAPVFVWAVLASLWAGHTIIHRMDAARTARAKKAWLAVFISMHMGLLAYFKYSGFFWESLTAAFAWDRAGAVFPALPIGISFFTFQAISYGVDVYRRLAPAQQNFRDKALYLLLFPQLIAGPIVRYQDIAPQLHGRSVRREQFAAGVERFIVGLAKKVILANTLARTADAMFSAPAAGLSAPMAWQGLIAYTLQIYFDFSGYSDMAIGLGKMFGFDFKENFDRPYLSVSVREFWRRWHISLSTWFRDYLYIPLGGDRKGSARTALNLFIVFFLCGLWHGAKWNFVVWGLFHGLFLILERASGDRRSRPGGLLEVAAWLYTMGVVMAGWVIFRADSLGHAAGYFRALAGAYGQGDLGAVVYADAEFWLTVLAAFIVEFGWFRLSKMRFFFRDITLILLYAFSAVLLAAGVYNPFIYYQF